MSERFNMLERDECIGEVVVARSTGRQCDSSDDDYTELLPGPTQLFITCNTVKHALYVTESWPQAWIKYCKATESYTKTMKQNLNRKLGFKATQNEANCNSENITQFGQIISLPWSSLLAMIGLPLLTIS